MLCTFKHQGIRRPTLYRGGSLLMANTAKTRSQIFQVQMQNTKRQCHCALQDQHSMSGKWSNLLSEWELWSWVLSSSHAQFFIMLLLICSEISPTTSNSSIHVRYIHPLSKRTNDHPCIRNRVIARYTVSIHDQMNACIVWLAEVVTLLILITV